MADLVTIGFKADSSQVRTASNDLNRLTQSGSGAEKQLSSMVSVVKLLGTSLAILGLNSVTRDVIDYSDSWKLVNNQLRQVTKSEEDLLKVRKDVMSIALSTRTDLIATNELYVTLTKSTKTLGESQENVSKVTKTINNLFLAGGKSAQEMEGAIRQLSQGLLSGALRGDEFNSVAENANGIMVALSKSLKMSEGDLRAFAATGGITSAIIVKALKDYSKEAEALADLTEKTFAQSLTNSNTNITAYIGKMESLNSIISSAGSGIESLTTDIDALADAIGVSAAILLSAAVPSVIKYGASIYGTAQAQLFLGTTAITTRNALGQVSVAAATTTVSMNALRLASAFLLSPLGLTIAAVAIGATAFSLFKDETIKAETSLSSLNGTLSDTESAMNSLGDAGKRKFIMDLKNDIAEAERQIKQYKDSVNSITNPITRSSGQFSSGDLSAFVDVEGKKSKLTNLNAAIEETQKTADKLAASLAKAESIIVSTSSASQVEKFSVQYKKLSGDIEREVFLIEDRTKAEILAFDISKKRITGLTTSEAELLIAKQKSLDLAVKDRESAEEAKKLADERASNVSTILLGLEEQKNQLTLTSDEYLRLQLTAEGATEAQIQQAILLQGQIKSINDELDASGEMNDLIDQVDNFGGAWSRTGNIITDSIGDIASGLNDYAKRISEITILQKKLEAERDKAGATSEDRLRAEQSLIKLSKESAQAQISGIASVAGAASQMFSEQSKGREKLHKVEQAFTAIEIAMAFEKAAANALVAITTQGSGDPYTAFARIAAMGAIMAGLGVFSGSTGGGSSTLAADRQASQGTGTVLGSSDKSQSISESFEAFKDIEDDQLTELKAIKNNMSQLSNGIAALAVSLISDVEFGSSTIDGMGTQYGYDKTLGADFGKKLSVLSGGIDLGVVFELGGAVVDSVLKSFKSTKKEVTDSGIRIGAQSLSDILNDGLEASYFDVIETTKKKNFGLSKSQSSETETSAIDSNVTDQIGNIFKMLGENVSESIAILGVEYSNSLNDFILDIGDVSFKDLTGEEIQAELESIISKQGDLLAEFGLDYVDVFQKIGEGALETLNRLAIQTSVFRDSLDTLNVSFSEIPKADLILFADNIIDLVGGLDSFMSLSSGFVDSFFSDAEKTQKLGDDLGEVFKSLNVPMSKSKDEFRSLVESIDLTSESGQELFSTLLQIAPAFAEYSENLIDAEEKIKESRLDAAKNAFDMLEKSVNIEKDRARVIFDSAKSSYSLEIERINGLRVGLDNLVGLSKTLNASVTLDQALSSARSGDFGFASNFKTTDLKQSDFSSFSDFAIAQAKQANKIESLALLAQDQMNELSLQEETAMMTLDIAEKQYEDEISRLDILIEVNLEMLNAALSIETSIKNLNESLYDFNNSINAINPQLVVARDNRESEQIRQRETEENVRAYLQEMNKSAKSTAKILQNIYLGGLDTRAIS